MDILYPPKPGDFYKFTKTIEKHHKIDVKKLTQNQKRYSPEEYDVITQKIIG